MVDILTSIHGKKFGLDASGNVVNDGPSIYVNNGSSPVKAVDVSVTEATTTANLSNSGISTISTALVTYTLDAPVAGARKTITALAVATAATRKITAAPATFDGTNMILTSTGVQSVELLGLSTVLWRITASSYTSASTANMGLSTS